MKVEKEIVGKLKREVDENQKKFFLPFRSTWEKDNIKSEIMIEDGGRLAVQVTKFWISFGSNNVINHDSFNILLYNIKKTITYLPENFRVVEIDKINSQALLCSEKPETINNIPEYFQLKVNPRLEFTLQRIRNINHKNEVIPFVISYQILERFIRDCSEMVNEVLENRE